MPAFPLRFRLLALAAVLPVLAVAHPAAAQGDAPATPTAEQGQAMLGRSNEMSNAFSGGLGYSLFDGDHYLDVRFAYDLELGMFGLGVQLPLHILLYDASPEMNREERLGTVFRREEWDEWSDYLKIVRYIRWGHKGDFLYARAGALERATIGHGTVLGNYYNNVRPDHWQLGLQFDVNTEWGGVETLVNDLLGEHTHLVGGRAYVRPARFFVEDSLFNGIAVGLSVVSDFQAPLTLRYDEASTTPARDGGNNLITDLDKDATIVGVDLEWRLIDWSMWKLTPYQDTNFFTTSSEYDGFGYHLGVLNEFPFTENIQLNVRFEYRYLTADYMPGYFSSAYEVERYMMPTPDPTTGRVVPKLAFRKNVAGRNGWYGEAAFFLYNWLNIGAQLEDYEGRDNGNLAIYAEIPALEVVTFSAWYLRRNFGGVEDAFALDDRSLLLASLQYQFTRFSYLALSWQRTWILADEHYEAVDDYSFGVGVNFSF